MSILLFVTHSLWSIIDDSGFVVSSVMPSVLSPLSFQQLTGKMGTRPSTAWTHPHHQDLPISRSWRRRDVGSGRESSPQAMPLLLSGPLRAPPTARVAPASNSPST